MAVPHWLDDPTSWDTIVLAGKTFPGLAKVEVDGGQDIDVKKPKGVDVGTLTYHGYKPKNVDILLVVWTREQWAELQKVFPDIEPKPGKKTLEPVSISYPTTTFRGVSSIAIATIKGPSPGPTKGSRQFSIKAFEFNPPKKSAKTATSTPKHILFSQPQFTSLQLISDDELRPSFSETNP